MDWLFVKAGEAGNSQFIEHRGHEVAPSELPVASCQGAVAGTQRNTTILSEVVVTVCLKVGPTAVKVVT